MTVFVSLFRHFVLLILLVLGSLNVYAHQGELIPKLKKLYPKMFGPLGVKNPPFYTVEYNGIESYILGTIHIGVTLAELPTDVVEKFVQTPNFYSEIDFDKGNEGYTLKESTNIEQTLLEALGAGYQQTIAENRSNKYEFLNPHDVNTLVQMGFPPAIAGSLSSQVPANYALLTPFFLFPYRYSLDVQLQLLTRHMGRPVLALEDDIIRTEAAQQTHKKIPLLADFINSPQHMSAFYTGIGELLSNYRDGTLEAAEEKDCSSDDLDMIYRNNYWLETLKPAMRERSNFIAVGFGHLCGQYGLVQKLQKAGFKVTRRNVN